MSKQNIEVNQCDEHAFDPENPLAGISTRKCDVCTKDYCNSSTHMGDSYRTTSHMTKPFTSFVCANCWKLLDYNGYNRGTTSLPKGNIDLRTSGSTSAINVAEYREWVESELATFSQKAVVEVLRALHEGTEAAFDIEKEKNRLTEKFETELATLKEKKYQEAAS